MKKTSSAKKGKGMEARKGPPPLRLSLDIETFSSVDLSKSGVYRYAEAPDFRILLVGYSLDHSPVKVADLASGRSLSYPQPRLCENKFGGESVCYMGPGPTRRWEQIESYCGACPR